METKMNRQLKTHEVLDFHYHPDEGQSCFVGTRQECEDFAATQSPHFMYKVVEMTKEEIENYPDNIGLLSACYVPFLFTNKF